VFNLCSISGFVSDLASIGELAYNPCSIGSQFVFNIGSIKEFVVNLCSIGAQFSFNQS